MSGDDRGASSAVSVILMVALTLVAGGTALYYYGDLTQQFHEPSFATVSAEQTTITDPTHIHEDECDTLEGHRELAVTVTLTQYQQADVIYVLVSEEGGTEKKVLWNDPDGSDVGETLTLANEVTDSSKVDVDIGGSGDWAYCPGEDATFEFYARYDGRTSLLMTFEF